MTGGTADTERIEIRQSTIISCLSMEKGMKYAQELAERLLCRSEKGKPCGQCAACRKIEKGIHPDVIFVRRTADSKGNRKKEILVDQIRELIEDAYILPNESDRKIYIIEDADKMNVSAQNAALKLLEEPPNGAVFILCAANPKALLPTVRSRCGEISIGGNGSEWPDNVVRMSGDYLRAVAEKNYPELLTWSYSAEKTDGTVFLDFLLCVQEMLADIICRRRTDIIIPWAFELEKTIERAIRYRKGNVTVKILLGMLIADSIPDDE